MSYENPDKVPKTQDDLYILFNTGDMVRELREELKLVGLKITLINYYKNEYCGDRGEPPRCSCPHWFQAKIESLHDRIYEPNVWVFVCKRKRVIELRFYTMGDGEIQSYVEDDFWINSASRTQVEGKEIHSNSVKQAAQDIRIAHQAAEIKDYKSGRFNEYYAKLFRKAKQ